MQASAGFLGWLDRLAQRAAEPVARVLHQLGISPNALTLTCLVGNAAVAWIISQGSFPVAGVALLLVNTLDVLDGAVARTSGRASDFGAFLDSVCDRYSELLVFLGLVIWYGGQADRLGLLVTFAAGMGAVMVSYARARAEGLGYVGETGLVQRMERVVLLALGLLLGATLLFWVLALLALITNGTALQRILHFKQQATERQITAGQAGQLRH